MTPKHIINGREFDLSLLDADIAQAYRDLGVEIYVAERPLLAQIARDLRKLVVILNEKQK